MIPGLVLVLVVVGFPFSLVTTTQPRRIHRTFEALQALGATKDDWKVPPTAGALLRELKQQLRDSFIDVLEQAPESTGPDLKTRFERSIRDAGVPVAEPRRIKP